MNISAELVKIEKGTEHAISAGWQDALKIGHFVEVSVVPALQKAQADAPLIDAVAKLAGPKAAALEAALFGGNGYVTRGLAAIASADALAADVTGSPQKVMVDITDLVATLKALL